MPAELRPGPPAGPPPLLPPRPSCVRDETYCGFRMQTGPDPSLSAKEAVSTYVDPLKRVTKAILVDAGSAKAKAAQADISQVRHPRRHRTPPCPARSIHRHRDPCPSCGPLVLCRARGSDARGF